MSTNIETLGFATIVRNTLGALAAAANETDDDACRSWVRYAATTAGKTGTALCARKQAGEWLAAAASAVVPDAHIENTTFRYGLTYLADDQPWADVRLARIAAALEKFGETLADAGSCVEISQVDRGGAARGAEIVIRIQEHDDADPNGFDSSAVQRVFLCSALVCPR